MIYSYIPALGWHMAQKRDGDHDIFKAFKTIAHGLPPPTHDLAFSGVEENQRASFKAAALATFALKTLPVYPHLRNWTDEQEAIIAKALGADPPAGCVVFSGGEHRCIISDDVPGKIFKQIIRGPESSYDRYIAMSETARSICRYHNLYLLQVPTAYIVYAEVAVATFYPLIMEEYIPLLGNFAQQEGAYHFALHDNELQVYMRELLTQLARFICLMNFADVKVDNISLTTKGRVLLSDLDTDGAVVGLTEGFLGFKEGGGLFSLLPSQWFDAFTRLVGQHLTAAQVITLNHALPAIKTYVEEKEACHLRYERLYCQREVYLTTTPLIYDPQLISGDTNIQKFAAIALPIINSILKHNLDYVSGRKICLSLSNNSTLIRDLNRTGASLSLAAGCTALYKAGYILNYRIVRNSTQDYVELQV